jgi:uncharacterized zinc-type alcohol dehydrogenase-like protein
MEAAGPIFCAGITMYSPLAHWGALSGKLRVGVVGIGGLGQMGVRLAAAMGNKVTAVSTTISKKDAALEIGATTFVVSTDKDSMASSAGSLDLILNTVSAAHEVGSGNIIKVLHNVQYPPHYPIANQDPVVKKCKGPLDFFKEAYY